MDDGGVGVQGPSEGAVGADRRVFPLHKVFVLVGRYDGRTNTVCAVSAFALDGVCVIVFNDMCVIVFNDMCVIVFNDMCVVTFNRMRTLTFNRMRTLTFNRMRTLTFNRMRSSTKSITRIGSKDLHKQTIIGRVDDLPVAHVKTTW